MADVTNESGLRSRVKSALRASRGWPVDLHPGPAADAVLALISPAGEVGRADALLREVFAGKVQVAFAGNPNVCDDLEHRVHKYLSAAPRGMEG